MSDASVQLSAGDWPAPQPLLRPPAVTRRCISLVRSRSRTGTCFWLPWPILPRTCAPLHSRDSALMIEALRRLGAEVELVPTDSPFGPDLQVTPLDFSEPGEPSGVREARHVSIECGLAGTVMRFVPALVALLPGEFTFDGDPHARQRPYGPRAGGPAPAGCARGLC